jgi:hypothetical protein
VKIETTSNTILGRSVGNHFSSGALIDPQWVLTTSHTLPLLRPTDIIVHFANGDEVAGDVLFRNNLLDLALIKLQKPRYEKPIPLGAQAPSGTEVNIHGFTGDYKVVSGDVFRLGRFVVRVAIEEGMAGGPVELDGELVGVVLTVAPIGVQSPCRDVTFIKTFLGSIE